MKMTAHFCVGILITWLLLVSSVTPGHETSDEGKDAVAALTVVDTEDINEVEENTNSGGVGIQFASGTGAPGVEVFKPTKEWQTVEKNQPIPKGLHIRYNLQTGHVEAKLLDKDETSEPEATSPDKETQITADDIGNRGRLLHMRKSVEEAMADLTNSERENTFQRWKQGAKEGMVNLNKESFTKEDLKEALKKFKKEDDDVKGLKDGREKFRSMQEIKEELKDLQLNMKTDTEILIKMLAEYGDEDIATDSRVHYLSEFDYYLHQIDNAVNFIAIGGFDLVVKDLNHTSDRVRQEAALVIGTSTQSNPQVQIYAMKEGVLHKLIRMISIEPTNTVRGRVIYAISCLIRHFPFAQREFMKNGGIQALSEIFKQPSTDRLRLKAITLIVDLFEEKHAMEEYSDPTNEDQKEKLNQYRDIPVKQTVIESGWCDIVPELLTIDDHDTREKVLHAMKHLVDSCPVFVTDRWRLHKLHIQYKLLSEQEEANEPNGYFHSLLQLIDQLSGKLEQLHHNSRKEEL